MQRIDKLYAFVIQETEDAPERILLANMPDEPTPLPFVCFNDAQLDWLIKLAKSYLRTHEGHIEVREYHEAALVASINSGVIQATEGNGKVEGKTAGNGERW